MSTNPRLETIEIEFTDGTVVRLPAASSEQATAFAPPIGLRWHPLEITDASVPGGVRTIQVLALQ